MILIDSVVWFRHAVVDFMKSCPIIDFKLKFDIKVMLLLIRDIEF